MHFRKSLVFFGQFAIVHIGTRFAFPRLTTSLLVRGIIMADQEEQVGKMIAEQVAERIPV
jgi:hypothetical protein